MKIDPSNPPPEFGEGVALAFMLAATLVLIGAQVAAFAGPIWPLLWPVVSSIYQPLGWAL